MVFCFIQLKDAQLLALNDNYDFMRSGPPPPEVETVLCCCRRQSFPDDNRNVLVTRIGENTSQITREEV